MTLSRFEIDYTNKKLYITADAGLGHHIAAIKVDSCNTFNCKDDASINATTVYTGSEQVLEDYSIALDYIEGDLSNNLFFAYIYVDDPEAYMYMMKPFYDSASLARNVFDSIKRELLPCDRCAGVSDSVTDKVMLYFGFKEAMEQNEYRYACDFMQAIYKNGITTSSNCGCHGR